MTTYIGMELRNSGVAYSIVAEVLGKGEVIDQGQMVPMSHVVRRIRHFGIPLADCIVCIPPDQKTALEGILAEGDWRPQIETASGAYNRQQRRLAAAGSKTRKQVKLKLS